jgi:Co/Zn/Cd efflux system component
MIRKARISAQDTLGRLFVSRMWGIATAITLFAAATVAYALAYDLIQLRRDGTDWIYDIVFYVMAAVLYGRGVRAEQAGALALGTIMVVAGLHTLYDLWDKVQSPRPIEPILLGFSAVSAAASGFIVVWLLLPFRQSTNPLIEATWLSARNMMISTAAYASVTFFARLATSRTVEYGLDIFAAMLCFQAAFVIFRDALRDPRTGDQTG